MIPSRRGGESRAAPRHGARGRAAAFLLGLGLAVGVRTARAEGDAAAAEALFQAGRRALSEKRYDEACEQFRESSRLDPATGTFLNLADCEEQRGRLATAWELFQSVASKLPATDRRSAIARRRADALSTRVPKIVLHLAPGAPADTRVLRGGAEYGPGSFGTPLPIDPGKLQLKVVAEGREANTTELDVAEGQTVNVDVAPGGPITAPAAAPAKPVPAPVPDGPARKERAGIPTLAWVSGGVAVAGLATGAVAGVLVLGKKKTYDENCFPAEKRCNQTGADAASAGRTLGVVSTVGWILGAVGAAGAAYFVLTKDGDTEVGVLVDPLGGNLAATGKF